MSLPLAHFPTPDRTLAQPQPSAIRMPQREPTSHRFATTNARRETRNPPIQTPPASRNPHRPNAHQAPGGRRVTPCAQTILARLARRNIGSRYANRCALKNSWMRVTCVRPPLSNAGLRARMATLVPGSGGLSGRVASCRQSPKSPRHTARQASF
jgi:hypothetical protein